MDKYCLTKISNFLTLFLTLLALISLTQPTSASIVAQSYTNFIKSKCSVTTYPVVCLRTLYPYAPYVRANSLRLCYVALNVAIDGARNASKTISKLAIQNGISRIEAAAFKDCIYDVKDAIYELKQTLVAMGNLRGADREFEWSNAKTWASSAITDAESCMDGFTGRQMNPIVRKNIRSFLLAEERLISNALFLINHLY